jgi:hypothetical protein
MGLIPSAADITADGTARGFAVGAGLWWLVTTIVAVFVGALVASRLLQPARRDAAALHGLATWGVATVIWVAAMTTIMGGILGGAVGAMNSSLAVVTARSNVPDAVRAPNSPADARSAAPSNRPLVSAEEAREAAKTATAAALWGFAGLLLSAGAGCMGGVAGGRRHSAVVENQRRAPQPAV